MKRKTVSRIMLTRALPRFYAYRYLNKEELTALKKIMGSPYVTNIDKVRTNCIPIREEELERVLELK